MRQKELDDALMRAFTKAVQAIPAQFTRPEPAEQEVFEEDLDTADRMMRAYEAEGFRGAMRIFDGLDSLEGQIAALRPLLTRNPTLGLDLMANFTVNDAEWMDLRQQMETASRRRRGRELTETAHFALPVRRDFQESKVEAEVRRGFRGRWAYTGATLAQVAEHLAVPQETVRPVLEDGVKQGLLRLEGDRYFLGDKVVEELTRSGLEIQRKMVSRWLPLAQWNVSYGDGKHNNYSVRLDGLTYYIFQINNQHGRHIGYSLSRTNQTGTPMKVSGLWADILESGDEVSNGQKQALYASPQKAHAAARKHFEGVHLRPKVDALPAHKAGHTWIEPEEASKRSCLSPEPIHRMHQRRMLGAGRPESEEQRQWREAIEVDPLPTRPPSKNPLVEAADRALDRAHTRARYRS